MPTRTTISAATIHASTLRDHLGGALQAHYTAMTVTHQRQVRLGTRALLAGVAVGIATLAVNVVGIEALDPGNAVTASVSHQPPSTTPPARPTAPPSPTPEAPTPPFPVQRASLNLADPSRDTPARGGVPAHAGRVLTTVIRRPGGRPGPLPLVVFAHGWNVNPTSYEPLLDEWAAAGYLVAAPTFPDSANTLAGSPVSNYPDQARDVSFVISSLLAGSEGPVDPARIAVAGHSDGGTDVALLALNPSYADHRVRAYLSLSGEIPSVLPGPWGDPTGGSLLVAVGTNDRYGLLPRSTQVFEVAKVAAKVMLTVTGGDHMGIYTGSSPDAAAMRQETVRFLDAALRPAGATSGQLTSALDPTGSPSLVLEVGPGEQRLVSGTWSVVRRSSRRTRRRWAPGGRRWRTTPPIGPCSSPEPFPVSGSGRPCLPSAPPTCGHGCSRCSIPRRSARP